MISNAWILEVVLKASLIIVLGLLLVRLRRSMTAATKHGILATTVVAALCVPLACSVLPRVPLLPAWGAIAERGTQRDSLGASEAPQKVVDRVTPEEVKSGAVPRGDAIGANAPATSGVRTPLATTRSDLPAAEGMDWSLVLLGVWGFGAAWLGLRLCLGQRALRRSLALSTPPDPALAAECDAIAHSLSVQRSVVLRLSNSVGGPLTLGLFRATILLPDDAGQWSTKQRRAVLCHEMNHVKRSDVVWESMRRAFLIVYWFQPLAWILGRRMEREREYACDDVVLTSGHSATLYATCLVEFACGSRANAGLACGASGTQKALEERVLGILDREKCRMGISKKWRTVGCSGLFLVASLLSMGAVAPAKNDQEGRRAPGTSEEPLRSRSEFATLMSSLSKGMPASEAREILGEPEDVRTEKDGNGISVTHTKEIWRYGTNGHLTMATLGEVYIDTSETVQYVYGRGRAPAEGLFDERDLRAHLRRLGSVSSYGAAARFDPLPLIRAVNGLLPLGKEKALATIEEFLRVMSTFDHGSREGVFLVLRALFEVPESGAMPRMLVGASTPEYPKNPKPYPRFPLHIHDGIPLLLSGGYLLAGWPEQPEAHLAHFRATGTLRSDPLRPADNPAAALLELVAREDWIFAKSTDAFMGPVQGMNLAGNQVIRLLDSVYRVPMLRYESFLPSGDLEGSKKILEAAASLDLRWDPARQCYTFADGTTLPPREVKGYERFVFSPKLGNNVKVVVKRISETKVSLWGVQNGGEGGATIHVHPVGKEDGKPLARITGDSKKSSTTAVTVSRYFTLPADTEVVLIARVGDEVERSVVIKP